ncbi:response regulator transcription factor [Flavobacterium sp.]|uniref:response regulator transcription factor n=1 Tax=Flavobacterium sp. TaxID=239 RepID=UPI002604CBDD|nr:response regulator transcription factor [Flavobacterium sp.]
MITIALTDDHKLLRESLTMLFNSGEDFQVVFVGENGYEILEFLSAAAPEIIILDIQMPGLNGFETLKMIKARYPDQKVMMLSQICTREGVNYALSLGANGFVSKNANFDVIAQTVRKISTDDYCIGTDISEFIRKEIASNAERPKKNRYQTVNFTETELKVLKMAAKEQSSSEIASNLFITSRTVESHRKNIMIKTNSRNFIGAILFALENNYISF